MTVNDIKNYLDAKILCLEENAEKEVHMACGADMMSDVLAFVKEQSVLLTGLCNPQTIRTAEMMDMVCIVFVRGKQPTDEIIELARDRDIVLMTSEHRMFTACGILYSNGLEGGDRC